MTCFPLTHYSSRVDREEIMRVLRAFEAGGLEYVLIGAAAMAFHGIVRAAEGFEFLIQATPENVERLRSALRQAYDGDPHINEISTTDLLGEYPVVRYYPPTGDIYFDLLSRLCGAANFETVDAELQEFQGTTVSVATPLALYKLNKGTTRAQDHVDAAALRQRFNFKNED